MAWRQLADIQMSDGRRALCCGDFVFTEDAAVASHPARCTESRSRQGAGQPHLGSPPEAENRRGQGQRRGCLDNS